MARRKGQWIERFVEDLAAVPSGNSFTNFYSTRDDANAVRRHNLARYLRDVLRHDPRVLLVGEAPGYRGTKVTGVPFADVPTLTAGVPGLEMLGCSRGYQPPLESDYPPYEQTSSVMWEVLHRQRFVPLLWAAFPFHPHGASPSSNRPPTSCELDLGGRFLLRLLEDCSIDSVVAVGRVAERKLSKLGIPTQHVRHPARGGKRDFEQGIDLIVRKTSNSSGPNCVSAACQKLDHTRPSSLSQPGRL